MNLIDLRKLTQINIQRSKKEELLGTKEELSNPSFEVKKVKNIVENDIYEFFLNLDDLKLSEEKDLFLTDKLWYYFKNSEESFLLYDGIRVWNSKYGVLI